MTVDGVLIEDLVKVAVAIFFMFLLVQWQTKN